jgi:stalled ribosome rescue protein Dom34
MACRRGNEIRVKQKKSYRRGYPVALLVGLEEDHAVMWQVFSQVVKLYQTHKLSGKRTDDKALYEFHESILNTLRSPLKEGVRSVVVTAPIKTAYVTDFLDHVRRHHAYLLQPGSSNRTTFAELHGSANCPHDVAELVKTKDFQEIIVAATSEEADQITTILDRNLGGDRPVLFALKEIEDAIYSQERNADLVTAYLVLTDSYLAESKCKNRLHRLMQIAANKKVKTKIVKAETSAGKRITQMGGLVYFSTKAN